MKSIVIACILATVGCGPAFTEAADGPIATTDGAVGLETDAIDGGGPETSAIEVDGGPEVDAGTVGKSDADPPPPDAGIHDARLPDASSLDASDPPDVHVMPPRCDGVFGISACGSWAATYCAGAGEAMCCRSDGICGCKVTSTAACQ